MNIFEIGWKVLNHMHDIQRVIQLTQPTLNAYNAHPAIVSEVQKVMNMTKPIVDEYSKVENELIPLATSIINDIFPLTLVTKAVPRPVGGYDVKWLQESINKITGSHLHVDGDYGHVTRGAIKAYQQHLVDRHQPGWDQTDVDGWAGMKTCAAIYSDLAK